MNYAADSVEGRRIVERAERLVASADRAFNRWISGEVESSSGAASLRAKADEALADVRLFVEDGEQIEARIES